MTVVFAAVWIVALLCSVGALVLAVLDFKRKDRE